MAINSNTNGNFQYLPVNVVKNTLMNIMRDLSNKKDRRFSSALKSVEGKPNTFHIISPDSNTYEMNVSLFANIFKELNRLYPNGHISITTPEKIGTGAIKSNFNRIIINKGDISIKVFLNRTKKVPEMLRPGVALEEYVASMIKDDLRDLKDWMLGLKIGSITAAPMLHKLNVKMEIQASNNTKIIITNITGAKRVGASKQKPDILINCRNVNRKPLSSVKISLKQSNFGYWSSANQYKQALYILENAIATKKVNVNTTTSGISIFDDKVNGIYVPATKEEVSKYCFGEGINRVNYIVIDGSYQGMDEFNVIHMNCNRFYSDNLRDIERLQKDVFLLISEDIQKNPSGLKRTDGTGYRGFDIQFVNGTKLKESGKKYIQVSRP